MKMRLVESASIGRGRLDKANCVVHGVKILGHKSAHGYSYSKEAMLEAINLYEGRVVNVNHPKKGLGTSRSYQERFGRLKNVEYQEGKGLFGDLHYNGGHRLRKQFEWDVENEPKNVGLSHNASGSSSRDGKMVESIDTVRSVDLVADPATNVSLFEDKGERNMAMIARRKRRTKRSDRQQKFDQLMEAIASAEEDSGNAMPTPREAMAKMVMAIFMDDSLDAKSRRDKINKLLDMEEDVASGDDAEDEESASEEVPEDRGERPWKKGGRMASKGKKKNGKLMESVSDVAAELQRMKHERRVKDLCESVGFRPSRLQLRALMSLTKKDEVKELIESMSDKTFERPLKESKGGKVKSKKPKSRASQEADDDVEAKVWMEGLLS